MDAQCQAIACVVDLLDYLWKLLGFIANHMQYGAKYFFGQLVQALQFEYMGGHKATLLALLGQFNFGH